MKYVLNIAANLMIGWPSLALGYIVAAAVSGFQTGTFFYKRHEDAALGKFVTKDLR